jgi:hypothetical protein
MVPTEVTFSMKIAGLVFSLVFAGALWTACGSDSSDNGTVDGSVDAPASSGETDGSVTADGGSDAGDAL